MKARVWCLVCVMISIVNVGIAQEHWVSSVTATAHDHNIESFGYAEYVDDYGNDALGFLSGYHALDAYAGSPYASYYERIDVFHAA